MARRRRIRVKHQDPTVEMLDQVRRLMMLQLVVSGVQAKDIARVLGIDKSDVSRIVPARAIKKLVHDHGQKT